MSYVVTNIYENPGPYYGTSDKGEPVPGWGPLPVMAGGERVGVGQIQRAVAEPTRLQSIEAQAIESKEEQRKAARRIPAWLWVLGAGLLGAGVGVAQTRGKLRKVGLKP